MFFGGISHKYFGTPPDRSEVTRHVFVEVCVNTETVMLQCPVRNLWHTNVSVVYANNRSVDCRFINVHIEELEIY